MDLGVGWLECHKTILKEVISYPINNFLAALVDPYLVRFIMILLWTSSYAFVIELLYENKG